MSVNKRQSTSQHYLHRIFGMSKWNETGILRRKPVRDNFDDLLVFGYACKLFRDDDKALYIDQGKHLIPWMGDDKLKIDRYDGRGALSDLTQCEASKEGYDATRWMGLSESERKIEQLCDEDRYYSLHTNEEEDAMYKEEELKRKQSNEFQYSYDVPRDPNQEEDSQDSIPTCEEEVKPFVPPTDLDVPVDITIPATLKESARIEKTALFVSKQGPQMEILIKAKQADNPQFSFMNQSDPLYKYYRHVLSAIKAGRYKPQWDNEGAGDEEEKQEHESTHDDEHYLHPSLVQAQAPPSVLCTSVPYKPAADCAYTQLITRIQGNNAQPEPPKEEPQPTQAAMTQEQQQQYYQYYYSMQYYEYYKQIAQQYAAQAGCDPSTILQNPQLQEQIQSQASQYAQAACSQYMQQSSTNQYAQLVTNLAANIRNSPTPSEPAPLPPADPEPPPPHKKPETKPLSNPLTSLVHYSSDSEDEEEEEEIKVTIKVPPGDTALIIDKMANYVSKNGEDFENIVRAKGDPRFDFLNKTHEFYNYYKHKVEEYREGDAEKKPKDKKVIVPVCFSIKNPKEGSPKEIKSALPVEESDDEAAENGGTHTPPLPPLTVVTLKPVVEVKPVVVAVPPPTVAVIEAAATAFEVAATPKEESISIINGGSYIDADDPILEMIDLTDDLEERRDAKRAEARIKDKLAMVAKEKLASRSLQLERRKRAAMFLKMKTAGGEGGDTRTVTRVEDSTNGDDRLKEGARREKGKEEILHIEDSETEEGEIRHKHRSSKKKKSHKRSRHESSKSHRKKSKKRRRRSTSRSSRDSSS